MYVFYCLLLIPLLIQHFSISNVYIDYRRRNKIALLIFFLILTVLIAFRHESVGTDTRNYSNIFKYYSEMDWSDVGSRSVEFGFSYFIKIISLISKEAQFFFAVVAVTTVAMMYPTYKRLCADSSLTIVLFCVMSTFIFMFSGIRQTIAIGIGFCAYELTREKKFLPFVLTVLLAMTFHNSAFMLAAMYPLYHAKITRKWLTVVVPVSLAVFVFNRQIFSVLSLIIERYTKYDGSISSTGAYTMIVLFSLFTAFAFLIPDETKLDSEIIGLRNFLLFSLVLQMFAPLHTIAMRMNYYYIIFIPLLLPKIIACRNERWAQIAVIGRHVMVVFFILYFFIVLANNEGTLHVFPYHFFWENV